MKVGLVTTHFAINYGAVLQAYALRKTIEKLGHDCEIVNYFPNNKVDGRKMILNFKTFKSILFSLIIIVNINYRKRNKIKIQKFDSFINEYCHLSHKKYESIDALRNHLPAYNHLICGSDQIWNLNLFNDPVFFLRFEEIYPNIRYTAYAPSIAENMTEKQFKVISDNTKHFTSLSIRENKGALELSKYINKPVSNVLDPVFLLEESDWAKIAEPLPINEPYILCYSIHPGEIFTKALKIIRKELKLKLVYINLAPFDKYCSDISYQDLSPQNFIWLFKNADFICTSSFHGTAFSIIFKKQFYTIPSKLRASRHESLLEQLHLKNRLLFDLSAIDNSKEIEIINFESTSKLLRELKNYSINYLISALNQELID